jgi:hypothetical protein
MAKKPTPDPTDDEMDDLVAEDRDLVPPVIGRDAPVVPPPPRERWFTHDDPNLQAEADAIQREAEDENERRAQEFAANLLDWLREMPTNEPEPPASLPPTRGTD